MGFFDTLTDAHKASLNVANLAAEPNSIITHKDEFNWATGDLKDITLPKVVEDDKSPCAVACKLQKENCAVLRKRAAMFLKQKGCPSLVTSRKKKKKTSTTKTVKVAVTKKKASAKKKTTKKAC